MGTIFGADVTAKNLREFEQSYRFEPFTPDTDGKELLFELAVFAGEERRARRKKDKLQNRKSWLRKYGLSLADFEQLLEAQQHKCAICADDLKKPHIDHIKDTKIVRGVLCNRCNVFVGWLETSGAALLEIALEYIKRHNIRMEKSG